MIKNLEAAEELLALYKSLTLTEIQYQWDKYVESIDPELLDEYTWVSGGDVLGSITGFGTTGSCKLCKACEVVCSDCLYSKLNDYTEDDYPCLDNTYHLVDNCVTPEDLYTNLQLRIERLEEAIQCASIA